MHASKYAVSICSLVTATLLMWTAAAAQDAPSGNDVQGQLWADYHAHFYRTKRQEFYGDTGVRYGGGEAEFLKVYVRPSLRYHQTNVLRYRLSVGAFYTDEKTSDNTLEIRPSEGIQVNWPNLRKATIINVARVEQRIIYDTTTWERTYQVVLRYQLGTVVSLTRIPWEGLFVPLSAEFFWQDGDVLEYSDQLRVTAGLGRVIGESWIIDAVLTFEQKRSSGDAAFTESDIILRFQVKQLLSKRNFFNRVEVPDN